MSLEHILVVDYLLWQGYLFCDLDHMPDEQAEIILAKALQFTREEVREAGLDFQLKKYNEVGFSYN